jgi:hypothetical protein
MARRVRGDRAFARLLKQLPVEVSQEAREKLRETGQMLLSRALGRVPVYSGKPRKGVTPGALRGGLSFRLAPVRLSLKVGLVGAAINRKLFYGRLVEFGHRIARGSRLPKLATIDARRGTVSYRLQQARRRQNLRRSGVPPHPFLFTMSRQEIYRPFQRLWGEALRKAAAGATDD